MIGSSIWAWAALFLGFAALCAGLVLVFAFIFAALDEK